MSSRAQAWRAWVDLLGMQSRLKYAGFEKYGESDSPGERALLFYLIEEFFLCLTNPAAENFADIDGDLRELPHDFFKREFPQF